jgi:hypothetical protein
VPNIEECFVAATIGILIFVALSASDGRDPNDIQSLAATIEALQQPVHDFRCEYEGTTYLKGKNAETIPVGADGLFETYSGTYIWQKGGDIRSESLHRLGVNGQISRRTLAVRARDRLAFEILSGGHPREVPSNHQPTGLQSAREGLGEFFPINLIKLMTSSPGPAARRRTSLSPHRHRASTGQRGSPADLAHSFSSRVPLFGIRGAGAERGSSR